MRKCLASALDLGRATMARDADYGNAGLVALPVVEKLLALLVQKGVLTAAEVSDLLDGVVAGMPLYPGWGNDARSVAETLADRFRARRDDSPA